uniref:RRM domain-containing protein n=1 Tax=Steinernema glaseri TaxID=37863 RepID=A0A1I8AVV9_9BILA
MIQAEVADVYSEEYLGHLPTPAIKRIFGTFNYASYEGSRGRAAEALAEFDQSQCGAVASCKSNRQTSDWKEKSQEASSPLYPPHSENWTVKHFYAQ